MKIDDDGVIGASFMDFTIPSEFAKNALYCCPKFGHFYCDKRYRVERKTLDSFLALYVRDGALTVESRKRTYTVGKAQVALLDCHFPHCYYCRDSADFLWFHFNGNNSEAYGEYLYRQSGVVFSGGDIADLEVNFVSVLETAREDMVNEHQLSLRIGEILCALAGTPKNMKALNILLRPAAEYIRNHYQEAIDLAKLSELCRISTPHLIRCFRKYVNCTPHEYLLSYRLRQSKQFLAKSDISIEQVAEQCGFNSASHFTRAFHKSVGITPTEFRRTQF